MLIGRERAYVCVKPIVCIKVYKKNSGLSIKDVDREKRACVEPVVRIKKNSALDIKGVDREAQGVCRTCCAY